MQVPTDYSVVMCRIAREQGADLLEGTGRTLADIEARPFQPLGDYLRILGRFTELQTASDWGFRFGQQLSMANHGPLGFGAMSAPTVRDGLAFMSRYIKTRASYLDSRMDLRKNSIHLVFKHHSDLHPFLRRSCETLAMIFQSFIESAGATTAPTVWRFPYDEPDNCADYENWLHGGHTFDADALRLEVPASVGMVPSAFRNDVAYQSTMAQCEAILLQASTDPLVDRVRGILASHIDRRAEEDVPVTGIPSAEEVAGQLQVSRRTLIRHLQAAGVGFQSMKDDILRDRILMLLGRRELSISEIAGRLGYSDTANFTRACRRMFDATPLKLRRDQV